jgi:multidrug resistance efflux pump
MPWTNDAPQEVAWPEEEKRLFSAGVAFFRKGEYLEAEKYFHALSETNTDHASVVAMLKAIEDAKAKMPPPLPPEEGDGDAPAQAETDAAAGAVEEDEGPRFKPPKKKKPRGSRAEGERSPLMPVLVVLFLVGLVGVGVAYVPINDEVTFVAAVQSSAAVTAKSPADGSLVDIKVKEGDAVKTGQVLASVATAALKTELDETVQALEKARWELEQLGKNKDKEARMAAYKEGNERKEKTLELWKEVALANRRLKAGKGTEADVEAAKEAALENDRAMKRARAALKLMRAGSNPAAVKKKEKEVEELENAQSGIESRLSENAIKSPGDGQITTANPQGLQGKRVKSGEAIFQIQSQANPRLRFSSNGRPFAQGQRVEFTLGASGPQVVGTVASAEGNDVVVDVEDASLFEGKEKAELTYPGGKTTLLKKFFRSRDEKAFGPKAKPEGSAPAMPGQKPEDKAAEEAPKKESGEEGGDESGDEDSDEGGDEGGEDEATAPTSPQDDSAAKDEGEPTKVGDEAEDEAGDKAEAKKKAALKAAKKAAAKKAAEKKKAAKAKKKEKEASAPAEKPEAEKKADPEPAPAEPKEPPAAEKPAEEKTPPPPAPAETKGDGE